MKKKIPRMVPLMLSILAVALALAASTGNGGNAGKSPGAKITPTPDLTHTERKEMDGTGEIIELTETEDEIQYTVYCELQNLRSTFTKLKSKLPEDSPIRNYKIGDEIDITITYWEYGGTGLVEKIVMKEKGE